MTKLRVEVSDNFAVGKNERIRKIAKKQLILEDISQAAEFIKLQKEGKMEAKTIEDLIEEV